MILDVIEVGRNNEYSVKLTWGTILVSEESKSIRWISFKELTIQINLGTLIVLVGTLNTGLLKCLTVLPLIMWNLALGNFHLFVLLLDLACLGFHG